MGTDTAAAQSSNLVLMNTDTLNDSVPGEPVVSPEQRVDELGRLLLEFKLTAEKAAERDVKTLKRLKRQVFWLKSGLAVALLGISAGVVGSSYVLNAQQTRLTDTVSAIAAQDGPNGTFVTRLDSLEKQTQQLDEKVAKELPTLLAPTTKQLDELSQTVATLEENLDQRKSVASVLATALQDLVDTPAAVSAAAPNTSNAAASDANTTDEASVDAAPADANAADTNAADTNAAE